MRLPLKALGADDLSFFEGLLLAAIYFETPKPVKPSHLAETFGTTRSNVSHCIASLEAKGLLQRKIDPSDAEPISFLSRLKAGNAPCAPSAPLNNYSEGSNEKSESRQ